MNTLLGFIETKIEDEFIDNSWKISKIGGHAIFPPNIDENELKNIKDKIVCKSCKSKLIFLSQIFCPLEIDNFDRIIYIFVCNTLNCNNWLILRHVFTFENPNVEDKSNKTNDKSWLNEENEWEEDFNEVDKTNELNENLSKINLNENLKNFTVLNDEDDFIKPYYLDVEIETKKPLDKDNHVDELLRNYKLEQNDNETNEFEKIDETSLLENYNNDILNYKFYKKISLYKGQVVRYSWKNEPLINSSKIVIEKLNCENCGSIKIFEFQLMPALINYLKFEKSNEYLNLDFATILFYTCEKNCCTKNFIEESYIQLIEIDQNIPEIIKK